jgi:hypothetical protein
MLREYQQRPVASSETQSVVRFEPLNLLTDEVHHAIREVVHRTVIWIDRFFSRSINWFTRED